MTEPPQRVGAPSELADAQEMPGCVKGAVLVMAGLPIFFFRELPTLPLDALVYAHEKGGWGATLAVFLAFMLAISALCWGLLRLI